MDNFKALLNITHFDDFILDRVLAFLKTQSTLLFDATNILQKTFEKSLINPKYEILLNDTDISKAMNMFLSPSKEQAKKCYRDIFSKINRLKDGSFCHPDIDVINSYQDFPIYIKSQKFDPFLEKFKETQDIFYFYIFILPNSALEEIIKIPECPYTQFILKNCPQIKI